MADINPATGKPFITVPNAVVSGVTPGTHGTVQDISAGNTHATAYTAPGNGTATQTTAQPQQGATVQQTTPQVGTLTANITNPANSSSQVSPPAVVTSDAAQKDLASKQAQIDQLNQDTQNHQAAVNTPPQTTGTTTPTNTTTQPPKTLDEQLSEALGNLTTQDNAVDQNTQTALTPIQAEQQQVQTQLNDQATATFAKLSQIASGTYPLSGAEQNLLSSTRDTYLSTIAAQTTANTAYQGQMAELAASLGISTSAPTQAIGLMNAAITSGNEKISTLNANMATSLANLQLGFQKQDYSTISDEWDKVSSFMENRVKTLQDMQSAVLDAAKQQKSDMMDQTKLVLSTMTDSAKFTYQQKQDAIDNAFKQQQISETQRHDLSDEATASYNAATTRENADTTKSRYVTTTTGGTTPTRFTTTQLNKGSANAGVAIKDFKALDPEDQNYFINSYATFAGLQKDIQNGTKTKADVQNLVQTSNLSDGVKKVLLGKLGASGTTTPAATTPDYLGEAGDFMKNLLGI